MPSSTEPRSGLLYGWAYGENGWNTGMDGNLLRLGRFGFHLSVKDRDAAVPPSPTSGACYLVGPGATGDWAGRDGQIAVGDGTTWQFASPRVGWRCYVEDEDVMLVFKTGGWGVLSGSGGGGGGIPDAPLDGQTYGRNDATWVPVGSGDGFAPYRGARIRPTAVQNYTVTNSWTAVRFATADRNSANSFWQLSAPNRLTIPVGVTKVRLVACVQVEGSVDPIESHQFQFMLNGSTFVGNSVSQAVSSAASNYGYNNPGINVASDVIDVSPGDYFELMYYASGSFSLSASGRTWFALEVVERTTTNAKLQELLDVLAGTPADGQSLVWDAATSKWKAGVPTVSYPGTVGMYKPFRGAMAKLTADFTLAAPPTPVPWQDVDYDTSGFWSAGSPSRLTIPAGVKKVRLHANLQFASATFTSAANTFINFLKNGSNSFRGNGLASNTSGYQDSGFTAVSGVIPVVAGDYFEVRWQASRAGTAVLVAASSQFSIEVVEAEETLP